MGKKIKLREARRRAAAEILAERLRAHSRTDAGPAFIEAFSDFAPCYRGKIELYRALALNAPEAWRSRLRSRSPELRFLELVRFTFARFPVPRHLENAWLADTGPCAERNADPAGLNALLGSPSDFRQWYIVATQGGSLHRLAAHLVMSKLETHHFLGAPDDVPTTQRAFWYAFARAADADVDTALRIARTKLSAFPVTVSFWKDAARFFAGHPTTILEMNDLIDFLDAVRAQNEDFSLHGRSLPALRRRMRAWHESLRHHNMVNSGRWQGRAQPSARYETGEGQERAVWRLTQIRSGNELFREGQRMHHCIVSYKDICVAGDVSIWSLTCECPPGKVNRCVTIEVRCDGTIAQCRGFANRPPYDQEVAILKRWACDNGLSWLGEMS